MVLRIHDLTYTGKTHIATSWYLVDDTSLNNYATNSTMSNVNSSTDLLFWSVDVSSETVPLSVIAIKHFDDNTEEKIGPVSVYNGQAGLVTQVLADSPVELPTIKLAHNTFINGGGEIAFKSSSIRPLTATLSEIHWFVRDAITGLYIYSEVTSSYDLILNTSKLDLSNLTRIDVSCCHKATNNVMSGFASFGQEVNEVDITLKGVKNISPDLPFDLIFASDTASSIAPTSITIYDSNKKSVYSSLDRVPIGTLEYNQNYSLLALFNVTQNGEAFTSRKVFTLTTIDPDKRRDIVYGTEALFDTSTIDGTSDKSVSFIVRGDVVIDTEPTNGNLLSHSMSTGAVLSHALIPSSSLSNDRIEVLTYNYTNLYVSNFIPTNGEINLQRYPIDSLSYSTRPINDLTLQSSSSNVAVASHNEIYFVDNNELVKSDASGNITVVTSLPDVSYSNTSADEYRVNMINDTEMYLITNTNAILLINLISLEIDILNSFNRQSSELVSVITSNGGLFIIDGTISHLYDRTDDAVTETTETIKSLVIADNNVVYKVF